MIVMMIISILIGRGGGDVATRRLKKRGVGLAAGPARRMRQAIDH